MKTLQDKVKHVFVLMLENHSFDNIFAGSGITGLDIATQQDSNAYKDGDKKITCYVKSPAPDSMPTDPGHEFQDVVEQLTGSPLNGPLSGGKYPSDLNNSGFVTNYATSDSEQTGLPPIGEFCDVMKVFDTPNQLPVTYQLATEFAVCDHWHSSLPGPTWPNRFFVHGGSSAGLDHSPDTEQMLGWELNPFAKGFEYQHGSIFDRLSAKNVEWQLYHDDSLALGGQIPQVSSIHNIHQWEVLPMTTFDEKLKHPDIFGPYKAAYTFIEPNYGDIYRTYRYGSSQHPTDGMAKGEALIKEVYETIRQSDIWEESLLIITYDEHGGFYDHVVPPEAVSPGDNTMEKGYNQFGFQFDRYGIRVPAIVVSPYIEKGTINHTLFDHTSIIATLNELFSIGHLTQRDEKANPVGPLLTRSTPRTNCLTSLIAPVESAAPAIDSREEAAMDLQPLPKSGNLIGFLYILLKTKIELSDGTEATKKALIEEFNNLKTRGDARAYGLDVQTRVIAKRTEVKEKVG